MLILRYNVDNISLLESKDIRGRFNMKKEVIVVGAVIKNHQHQILCALRSSKMVLADYWEFPGGKVESGESHEKALAREIEEELGCQIVVERKITDTRYEYENVIVHLHTYWARIISGAANPKEHAELRWVAVDDLHELRWAPADIPTIEEIVKERGVFTNE